MGNHSKPVIDKENITDEERTRLLNRQKCRNYRSNHRESYREYQRNYRAANRNRPSVLHHFWKSRLIIAQATYDKWNQVNTTVGRTYTKRAAARIAELQKLLADLNYTEINTGTSV